MTGKRLPPDERHFTEPEIIPPSHDVDFERDNMLRHEGRLEEHGIHRVYVTRLGPLGFLPLMLMSGVIVIALLAFLFGFLLILVPVAGFVLAATIIGSFLRGQIRWPR